MSINPENNDNIENNVPTGSTEQSAFDSNGIYEEGKEFMIGNTDTKDYADIDRKKKGKKYIAIIIAVLAILAIIGVLVGKALEREEPKNAPTTTQSPTQSSTPQQTKVTSTEDINPILGQYQTAPEVIAKETIVTVDKDIVSTNDGNTLFMPKHTIKKTAQPCKVTLPTDFCLAGKGEGEGVKYDIYYLKDAAHSRLFENAKNFVSLNVENSPSAGTLDLNIGTNEADTGVIVNPNSSGWMLVKTKGEPKMQDIIVNADIK